jgi:predicted nucleic acid-binding protein
VSPRRPSRDLIVDANILLSVALGRRSRPVFDTVQAARVLLTSDGARAEVLRQAGSFGTASARVAAELLETINVVEERVYSHFLGEAAEVLRLAPASRNGSTRDAHVLAVAWVYDADIWSHDRDFAGTGWPSWSNANLRAALA